MLEAAITAVRKDGAGVSMDDIARAAGVTKPIVYRVFGHREGLTTAVADHFAGELAGNIQRAIDGSTDDRERVRGAIDAYVTFIESEPEILRFLIYRSLETINETGVAMSDFVSRLGLIITTALGEGLRERGVDSGAAEPWSYAIVGAVHMAGDWWLERKTMSKESLVEYLTSLVWDGMNAAGRTPSSHGSSEGSI